MMTPEQRLARAERWRQFYTEEGGIGDMLARISAELMQEAVKGEPWETDKLKKVALGLKITQMLNDSVKKILDDGRVAEAAKAASDKFANVPEKKRRYL